jgi:hypothetical protein
MLFENYFCYSAKFYGVVFLVGRSIGPQRSLCQGYFSATPYF